MAVRAAHDTFCDFSFRLATTPCAGDVHAFRAFDVVEIEGTGIIESTIDAANCGLVFVEPDPKFCGSPAFVFPELGTASRLGAFIVGVVILWIIRAVSRASVCFSHFLRIAFAPATGRLSLALLLFLNVHIVIVSCNSYSCKPVILEED